METDEDLSSNVPLKKASSILHHPGEEIQEEMRILAPWKGPQKKMPKGLGVPARWAGMEAEQPEACKAALGSMCAGYHSWEQLRQ